MSRTPWIVGIREIATARFSTSRSLSYRSFTYFGTDPERPADRARIICRRGL